MSTRVSYKVTEFNTNLLQRSMFETKRSYEYFLMGLQAAIQIQKLKESGNLILDNGEPIDPRYDFHIAFDQSDDDSELFFPRLGPHFNGGLVMWLGYTMGNVPNTVYVYKKELKTFDNISYIKPEDQHKLEFQY